MMLNANMERHPLCVPERTTRYTWTRNCEKFFDSRTPRSATGS